MSSLGPVLQQIARTTAATVGFGTTVINLHRPAWDDFQTVVVHGSDEARRILLGQTSTRTDWEPLLDARFERRGVYFIEHGTFDWTRDGLRSYIPTLEHVDGPEDWHPEDALFVPLRSSGGEVLGILSVDEPHDGRRPSDHQLDVLVGAASHAALALELGQQAAAATRQRAAVEHLLRVSTHLNERHSTEEMLESVCVAIRDALGFEKVCLFLIERDVALVAAASVGLGASELEQIRAVPLGGVAKLLRPELERDGVVLLSSAEAASRSDVVVQYSSRRNGSGPRAWNHHWLMVPLRDREGRLVGVIWADEPEDRLLPTREQRHALRAFANQAMSAMASAQQLAVQRHLAEHDPLTGLRNRRGLLEHIDAAIIREPGPVAVLVCDLDHFKRINDVLGYTTGDEALCRAANTIRATIDGLAPQGIAARLGGEEFALVLPGHGEEAAMRVAERLRLAVQRASDDLPRALTISIGVAVSGADSDGAAALLRDATRACVGAKRLGRNRSVAYHAATLDALLGTLDAGTAAAGEQLAAAMLLAETLDVRDGGTARHSHTVGRYAGEIARALGLDEGRVERIRAAGVLHDIGKLGVADAILKKPGTLTVDEWTEMRRHSELGARILAHANLADISGWVLAHHERLDGHGYPNGLAGEEIPVEARILAVADAYEAMTADRAYRNAMTPAAAQAELQRAAGGQFDPAVVAAFLRVLGATGHPSAGLEAVLPVRQDRTAWTPPSPLAAPPPLPKRSFAPASSS